MERAVKWCERKWPIFSWIKREIIITRPWKRLRPTCWVKYDHLPGNEITHWWCREKTNRGLAQCQVMLSSRMSDKGIMVDRKFHKRRGGKLTKDDRNCSRNWNGAPVNGAAGRRLRLVWSAMSYPYEKERENERKMTSRVFWCTFFFFYNVDGDLPSFWSLPKWKEKVPKSIT